MTNQQAPSKFKKKSVEIEAIQFNGNNALEVSAFIGKEIGLLNDDSPDAEERKLFIDTLEGQMIASCYDWIIKGVKGEFYPCKPDIFEMTYSPTGQAPSATVDEMREKMANCIATYCDKRVRDGDFDFFDAEVYIGELLKYLISDLHSQQEKRYTAQQMKDFAFDYHVGKYIRDTDKALDQFKSERGIK